MTDYNLYTCGDCYWYKGAGSRFGSYFCERKRCPTYPVLSATNCQYFLKLTIQYYTTTTTADSVKYQFSGSEINGKF